MYDLNNDNYWRWHQLWSSSRKVIPPFFFSIRSTQHLVIIAYLNSSRSLSGPSSLYITQQHPTTLHHPHNSYDYYRPNRQTKEKEVDNNLLGIENDVILSAADS